MMRCLFILSLALLATVAPRCNDPAPHRPKNETVRDTAEDPLPASTPLPAQSNYPAVEEVLTNLYAVYGNRKRHRPKLLLVNDNDGPRYRESSRTIVLDERSVQVCRSFGKNYGSALAFIIGHELAHFFQQEAGKNGIEFSYLAYSENEGSSPEKERMADVQGIFNAYLAGYRTVSILPDLIAKLYKSHGLSGRLNGYPTLEERQYTAAAVLATADTLKHLYEAANYLNALGQYEPAAASYQYILQYYPGREIYNNLGACLIRQAMYCSEKSPDAYLYPVEIDTDSRLKKPRARGGAAELSDSERQLRKQLLAQAEEILGKASAMDPDYFPISVNRMCVWTLQGEFRETIRHWERQSISDNIPISAPEKNTALLVLGIALAQSDLSAGKTRAEQIFRDLAALKSAPALALMGMHNLDVAQNRLPERRPTAAIYDCRQPFEPFPPDGVSIHRVKAGQNTLLPGDTQSGFELLKRPASAVLQFYKSGRPVVSIQMVRNVGKMRGVAAPSFLGKRPHIVHTPSGFFLICEEAHALFLFDANMRLVEWGRYYLHP